MGLSPTGARLGLRSQGTFTTLCKAAPMMLCHVFRDLHVLGAYMYHFSRTLFAFWLDLWVLCYALASWPLHLDGPTIHAVLGCTVVYYDTTFSTCETPALHNDSRNFCIVFFKATVGCCR